METRFSPAMKKFTRKQEISLKNEKTNKMICQKSCKFKNLQAEHFHEFLIKIKIAPNFSKSTITIS